MVVIILGSSLSYRYMLLGILFPPPVPFYLKLGTEATPSVLTSAASSSEWANSCKSLASLEYQCKALFAAYLL